MKRLPLTLVLALVSSFAVAASGQSPYASSSDFVKHAMKLRQNALLDRPTVHVPTTSSPTASGGYGWKERIVTTVFWVGERPTQNNPVPNHASSWDPQWTSNFGGYDNPDPSARREFLPAAFTPRQNPFYVALPYNDVTRGTTKPEARKAIPWFRKAFVKEGQSVCRDRWLAIRKGNRVCYAQWSDCGPFRTDHWEYVFGNDRPKPNLNRGAGLDVSPAVRDYLGMGGTDVTDWKFVEDHEVPPGPWAKYGDNNTVAKRLAGVSSRVVSSKPGPTPVKKGAPQPNGPTVITK